MHLPYFCPLTLNRKHKFITESSNMKIQMILGNNHWRCRIRFNIVTERKKKEGKWPLEGGGVCWHVRHVQQRLACRKHLLVVISLLTPQAGCRPTAAACHRLFPGLVHWPVCWPPYALLCPVLCCPDDLLKNLPGLALFCFRLCVGCH